MLEEAAFEVEAKTKGASVAEMKCKGIEMADVPGAAGMKAQDAAEMEAAGREADSEEDEGAEAVGIVGAANTA